MEVKNYITKEEVEKLLKDCHKTHRGMDVKSGHILKRIEKAQDSTNYPEKIETLISIYEYELEILDNGKTATRARFNSVFYRNWQLDKLRNTASLMNKMEAVKEYFDDIF